MSEPDMGDNSRIEVEREELLTVLTSLSEKAKAVSEATGSLRSSLKEVLDEKGWHKGALATIRSIAAMSPTARADYLRTFEPMFELMLSEVWAEEKRDLFDETEEEEGSEPEDAAA